MDKRRKAPDLSHERMLRQEIYDAMAAGRMSVGQAVAAMRRISRLTQPEFAKHRGLSVQSLRLIESDKTNPTIDTLGKIASIFGLQVGFVPKTSAPVSWQELEHGLSASAQTAPLPSSIERNE